MVSLSDLAEHLTESLGDAVLSSRIDLDELTVNVRAADIVTVCESLRDNENTSFDQLIDLCGMDYSSYGAEGGKPWDGTRFAVVYHLQSVVKNRRLRVRAQLDDDAPAIDSVIGVWPVADWFEREAFDLYGIIFNNHPDLRRLLTDYGFIGHPFRKDFPLSGQVEMHYDEALGRVVYRPATADDRILVPRTIRHDTFVGSRRGAPAEPPAGDDA